MKGKGMTLVQALMLLDLINGSNNLHAVILTSPYHHIWQLKIVHKNNHVLYGSSTAECMDILAMWSDEPFEDLAEVA